MTCQLWVWQMYFHITTNAPIDRNLYLLQTELRIPLRFPVSFSPSLYSFNLWWVCSYNFLICHYDFNICIGKNIHTVCNPSSLHSFNSTMWLWITFEFINSYFCYHNVFNGIFILLFAYLFSIWKTFDFIFRFYIYSSLDLLKYF